LKIGQWAKAGLVRHAYEVLVFPRIHDNFQGGFASGTLGVADLGHCRSMGLEA